MRNKERTGMPGEGTMAVLRKYLRDKRRTIAVLLIMCVIFYTVVLLYAVPAEAVIYASLLSGLAGCGAALFSFISYYRKHILLSGQKSRILFGMEGLGEPAGLIESDYQDLIALLYEQKQRMSLEHSRLDDEMNDYYTLWTHQIKVPLSALDLLIQTGSRDKPALRAELFRVEQYVEMALGYMRLESRSTDYLFKSYPLDPIIRGALRKYARLFILSGVKLEYAETSEAKLTDEKWLAFVIEQLLSNAVKYTPAGRVTIYMEDGRLVIEDTGVGIDQSDLPRIFEKGFTGYNGRGEERSTGLGLYLCKKVMNKISHTITIESVRGEGTRVIIGFPDDTLIVE